MNKLLAFLPPSLIELDVSNNDLDSYCNHCVIPLNIEIFTTKKGEPRISPPLTEKLAKQKAALEDRRQAAIPGKHKELLAEARKFDTTIAKIDELLGAGADINYQDELTGFTALMTAIDSSNERIAEYLLNNGANPSLTNKKGKTAADLASSGSEIYKLIQDNRSQEIPPATPTAALTSARLNKDFHEEIKNGAPQTRRINGFLEGGANINYQDDEGYTAVMLAIDAQNDRIAEYLLKQGADPLLTNKRGETAAMLASTTSPVFQLLKDSEKEKQRQNESPITQLNKQFHEEICNIAPQIKKIKNFLKSGANINYQDDDGYTAVMLAVDNQNDRIAEYLLNEGADPLLRNTAGEIASDLASRNSPIFAILKGYEMLYASFNGQLAQVKAFLKSNNDIDFQGLNGYTALLIAAEQGMLELVKFLLSQGADPTLTLKDGRGIFDLVNQQAILNLLENQNYTDESNNNEANTANYARSELFVPSLTEPKSDYTSNADDTSENYDSEGIPLNQGKKIMQTFF